MNCWKLRARLRLAGPIPSETIRITNLGLACDGKLFALRNVTRRSKARTTDRVMKNGGRLEREVRRRRRVGTRSVAASSTSSRSVSSPGTRWYE